MRHRIGSTRDSLNDMHKHLTTTGYEVVNQVELGCLILQFLVLREDIRNLS